MGEPSRHRFHGETGIGNDTERIVVVLVIYLHGLLIVGGEHHLGTPTLTLGSGMGIEGLGGETLRLGEDIVVEIWQYGGIETDIVFYEQDHLYASLFDIVVDIHLILKQLDDRHNEVGIAQPAEHVVED